MSPSVVCKVAVEVMGVLYGNYLVFFNVHPFGQLFTLRTFLLIPLTQVIFFTIEVAGLAVGFTDGVG